MGPQEGLFGDERLTADLQACDATPLGQSLESLRKRVKSWAGLASPQTTSPGSRSRLTADECSVTRARRFKLLMALRDHSRRANGRDITFEDGKKRKPWT